MSYVGRRQFLIAAGVLIGAPFAAAQQTGRVFRVALLAGGGRTPDGAAPAPLRQAMQALGYTDGQNIAYVTRFAEAKLERLPGMAAELVGLKIDAIVALGGPPRWRRSGRPRPSQSSPRWRRETTWRRV